MQSYQFHVSVKWRLTLPSFPSAVAYLYNNTSLQGGIRAALWKARPAPPVTVTRMYVRTHTHTPCKQTQMRQFSRNIVVNLTLRSSPRQGVSTHETRARVGEGAGQEKVLVWCLRVVVVVEVVKWHVTGAARHTCRMKGLRWSAVLSSPCTAALVAGWKG